MSSARWNTELDLINAVDSIQLRFKARAESGTIVLVDNAHVIESIEKQFYLQPVNNVEELIRLIPVPELINDAKINLLLSKHRLSPLGEQEGTYAFGIRSRGFDEVIGLMATDLYFRGQDWLFFQSWRAYSSKIQHWFGPAIDKICEEHDDYYTLVYG